MQLDADTVCLCIECNAVVNGPHPCEPTEGKSSLFRVLFMINRVAEIARLARARQ